MPEQETILSGKWHEYEVIELTSRDNYYHSYQALHSLLQRHCYLKVVHNPSPEQIKDFKNKAREMAVAGGHPYVEKIWALKKEGVRQVGQHDGAYYAALEWADADYYMNLKDGQKSINDWPAFLNFMATVAQTLHELNYQNHIDGLSDDRVFHGNLMWRYLFMRPNGTPCICGFGLAERLSSNPDLAKLGISEGGIGYLSPYRVKWIDELKKNPDFEPIDTELRKHDIWSLGATMYHMITGQRILDRDGDIGELSYELARERALSHTPVDYSKLDSKVPEKIIKNTHSLIHACMNPHSIGGFTTMEDLYNRINFLKSEVTDNNWAIRFWPAYSQNWFEDINEDMEVPAHEWKKNAKRPNANRHLKTYLTNICLTHPVFEKDLDNKDFYESLKNFKGYHSKAHGPTHFNSGKVTRIPDFGSIILLLLSSLDSFDHYSSIKGLAPPPWRELRKTSLFPKSASKEEIQETCLAIRALFRKLSFVDDSESEESKTDHAIERIDYSLIPEGKLTFHTKFECGTLKSHIEDKAIRGLSGPILTINENLKREAVSIGSQSLTFNSFKPVKEKLEAARVTK